MRTTLVLDQGMVEELLSVTGLKNKTKAITTGLKAYIALKKRERLLKMGGTMHLEENIQKLREMDKHE
jgi:hypothetical protein